MNYNRVRVLACSLGLLALFLVGASDSFAQQSRCSICVFVIGCGQGQGGYGCAEQQGASTVCRKSNPDTDGCYQDCNNNLFCRLSAGKCDSAKPKTLSVRQLQEKSDQLKAMKDADAQTELMKNGASQPQIELQAGDPVTLIGAVHGREDVLKIAQIWNNSKKIVTAVRVAWLIKTPNLPDETVFGKWTVLTNELASGDVVEIPGQNVDIAPLKVAGTIMRFYVAEVKFQDDSVWQRNPEPKPQTNRTSSLVTFPSPHGIM